MSQPVPWSALVREARERLGWTQRELAARAGISTALVCRMESGERVGTLPVILAVARALDLDLNKLKAQISSDSEVTP